MNKNYSEKEWLVLYTRSRNEKSVVASLMRMGIETYCPMRRTRRKWSDRWKFVDEPLFKSYCFVRITEDERNRVFLVPGVVRYLFWLGKPARVRPQEIERIKCWLNDYDHETLEVLGLSPGDKVCIASGPLVGQQGDVVGRQGKHLHLRIEGIGVMLRVDLSGNLIEQQAHS